MLEQAGRSRWKRLKGAAVCHPKSVKTSVQQSWDWMVKPQRASKEFKLLAMFFLMGLVVAAWPSEAYSDLSSQAWKTSLGEYRFKEKAPVTCTSASTAHHHQHLTSADSGAAQDRSWRGAAACPCVSEVSAAAVQQVPVTSAEEGCRKLVCGATRELVAARLTPNSGISTVCTG